MQFSRITPILRIFDVDKATEFYVDFLGFGIDWTHRFGENFPRHLQVSRNGCVPHLTEHHGDCSPGTALRIKTTELDDFHAELTVKNYRYMKPGIEEQSWGSREMTVYDPFGNRLVFVAADT